MKINQTSKIEKHKIKFIKIFSPINASITNESLRVVFTPWINDYDKGKDNFLRKEEADEKCRSNNSGVDDEAT